MVEGVVSNQATADTEGTLRRPFVVAVFYVVVGVAFVTGFVTTCVHYPLFPFQLDSADWSSAWLIATIGDYYATSLCYCGIIIATEGLWPGVLWCAGVLFLGSGFSCLWVVYRVLAHKSLALKSKTSASGLAAPLVS
uniref:Uncharacterized protein n=1 Tax=Noctiluca scintillans TaxID=2966 RepID=A0A7S1B1Z2_NOCSC